VIGWGCQVKRSKAFGTAAQYDSALQEAAESAEWMLCVELLAEARLLQHALGSSTVEGAILCVSEGKRVAAACGEGDMNDVGDCICV
jgi:hypothetical protein